TTFTSIRRLVLSSYGLIAVNFRRILVRCIRTNVGACMSNDPFWEGTPFSQIEPAMAHQHGLPMLMIRESGTDTNRGIWEKGISPFFILEWDSDEQSVDTFFQSIAFREM